MKIECLFLISLFSFFLLLLLVRPLCAFGQQRFHRQLPPGNYSSICAIGNDEYAVVSDKTAEDGFYVFHLNVDSVKGRITKAENLGFRSSGLPNRDGEGICYRPSTNTVFISGETDNEVYEYTLDGQRTGQRFAMPQEYKTAKHNVGLEALTYDRVNHLFYTTTEQPLPGDTMLRIQSFGDDLQPRRQYLYQPDERLSRFHYHGVAELLALGDGRLLVLERQVRIPKMKIGASTIIHIYEVVIPESDNSANEGNLVYQIPSKRLVTSFKTRLTLTSRKFANYEGMCQPAPGLLLLVADSQDRYRGVLRDWFKLLQLNQTEN